MNGILPGATVQAVVTTVLPFGVLVEAEGLPGLVRGVRAAMGETVAVRVLEYDDAEHRFSAMPTRP
jgi:ribosomal protein S1